MAGASAASLAALLVGVGLHLNGTRDDVHVAAVSAAPVSSKTAGADDGAFPGRATVAKSLPLHKRFCLLMPGTASLPAARLRGLAHHLRQYPELSLVTAAQAGVARNLLTKLRGAALRWRNPDEAAAAGFDMHTARRAAGDTTPHYLHAESRQFAADGRYLDPERPEALIYANVPGHPLLLIGVMFSMPRGVHGPSPAGPITRWHFHRVCTRGNPRGLTPLADGFCPRGETLREGSEMLHVWFTEDLRSAYAIHAPEPELCDARLLPATYCASGRHLRGM